MCRASAVRSVAGMSEVETVADFTALAGAKYILLTTFRRDGTPVSTPVWHVVVDGVSYVSTGENVGKVKRIRRSPDVTISACTLRGRPTGPTFAARARILSAAESRRATRLIRRRFPSGHLVHAVEKAVRREGQVGIAIEAAG
jgi:PPOX class probable F420-dependent enzyme